MSKIFVYGSLRKGGGLHPALNSSECLGTFKTKPMYSLYSLGAFPALVADGLTSVVGELYEVTNDVLSTLDRIEGHPHFYIRTPITLENGLEAEVYLLPHVPYSQEFIESGDWITYHGVGSWGQDGLSS